MIYAILPFVVLGVCLWLGRRTLTVAVIFAYVSVEGFLKLASNYNPVVHIGMDIVVLGVAAWWALEAALSRRAGIPRLPWVRLIGIFALWVLLELLNPYSPGLLPSLASLKIHLAAIPLYFMVPAAVKERKDVLHLLLAITLIACVPYVTALAQYALGPASVLDLSPRAWQNISFYHEWRPFGTSAVPGGASVSAFLFTPVAVILLVAPALPRGIRLAALASLVLGAGAFIVSGVRQTTLGAIMAMLVLAGIMATRGRSRGVAAVVLLVMLSSGTYLAIQAVLTPLSAAAVAKDPRSPDIWRSRDVTTRLLTLAQGKTYLEARVGALPVLILRAERFPFGAGLGRTGSGAGTLIQSITSNPESAKIQEEILWADNYYSDMIVETGIPGLLMIVILMGGFAFGAARLARGAADPLVAATAGGLAGIFVAYLVMSWGSQPLEGSPTLAAFWAYAGIYAALRRLAADVSDPAAAQAQGAAA